MEIFDQLLVQGFGELQEEESEYVGAPPCAYCGFPGSTIDHVIPRSLLNTLRILDDSATLKELYLDHRIKLVRACRECNSLLSNRYFDTFEERKAFLKQRLRIRYAKILTVPDWKEEELNTLSVKMRGYILNSIAERDLIRARLKW